MPPSPQEESALIVAPTGQDAAMIEALLEVHGLRAVVCSDPGRCLEILERGAAALLLTEEALAMPRAGELLNRVKSQPPWSELPIILFTSGGETRVTELLELASSPITLLERPIARATLLRSVNVAMSARRRQYQMRDLLEQQQRHQQELRQSEERFRVLADGLARQALELADLNQILHLRVKDRTAQLQELNRELAQTEHRERTQLAQVLHDGLQQFLVAARMHAELIAGTEDRRTREEQCRRLQQLLNEAITASRSLTFELSPPALQSEGLVPALQWLAKWVNEKHQFHVELATSNDAELWDPAQRLILFQCVRELVLNAIKHSGTRTARIRFWQKPDCREACLEVADEGKGFSPELVHRQGDSFGFAGIRRRLELIGGTADVKSAPGHGSQITLSVPVRPRPTSTQAPVHLKEIRRVEHSILGHSRGVWPQDRRVRLLLVDDHQIVREGLAEILRKQPDLELVGEAADGFKAIELAIQLEPDVILMDIHMPRLDGVEATRRIRAALPRVWVIGLSTCDDAISGNAMRQAGAAACLTKDQPVGRLLSTIRSVVGAQ